MQQLAVSSISAGHLCHGCVMTCHGGQHPVNILLVGHVIVGRQPCPSCMPCIHAVLTPGLAEGMFDFVEIKTIKAVQIRPIDRESHWNCDGELLPENHISIRAHRGLVQVCNTCSMRVGTLLCCVVVSTVGGCVVYVFCRCGQRWLPCSWFRTGVWVGALVARG